MFRGCLIAQIMITVTVAFALLSCSGSESTPLLPPAEGGLTAPRVESSAPGGKMLWGLWDVMIDPASGTIETVPIRGPEFTANVTVFLQPPKGSLNYLKFTNLDLTKWFDQGLIELDVGLTHPFPGYDEYTGFDVLGVFRHNASYSSVYDPGIRYGKEGVDGVLLNPDGYTRWFNALEFPKPGILGYVAGKAGTPGFEPDATLSPFKYFADGLEELDDLSDFYSDAYNCEKRGCFRASSTNYRHYVVGFPVEGGAPILRFQYAVVASWEPYDAGPPYPPEDFPISANIAEPLVLGVDSSESSLYFIDPTTLGGLLRLKIEIMDHQAGEMGVTMEIAGVGVESPVPLIPGGCQMFDQTALGAVAEPGGPCSSVYTIDIPNCEPALHGETPILITVLSADPTDYDSGVPGWPYPEDAALAGYWGGFVVVGDEVPDLPPVGGDLSLYWDCPGDPCSGQPFTMEISDAYDPDGDPVTITWDFDGDMDFADDMDGDDTNLTAEYVYDTPGAYECWCRLDDGTSHTDIGPFQITVLDCMPDEPTLLKTVPDPTGLQSRKIAYNPEGGYAYTCPHYSGPNGIITIVDVDPVDDAQVVNTVVIPGAWLAAIAYSSGYVYTSGGYNTGVLTIDVDPAEDAHVESQWAGGSWTGTMEDIHVVNDYLYVASQWGGLLIFDISNPAQPVFMANSPTLNGFTAGVMASPDNQWGYFIDGYHTNENYYPHLNIVDISDPTQPSVVTSLQLQTYKVMPHNCDLLGDYFYIVYHPWTGTAFLTIVDVSDPYNPVKVTDFSVGTGTWDVEVVGNYAYVAKGNITILDVSNPSSPFVVSTVSTPSECRGTAVYCGMVYCTSPMVNIVSLY